MSLEPIHAGLWSHKTRLAINDPEGGAWAYRVQESNGEKGIPALSVEDLLQQAEADIVDVLKVDIEGAEREVFSQAESWIRQVRMIIVETHDQLCSGCSEAVESVARRNGFRWSEYGENTILTQADM